MRLLEDLLRGKSKEIKLAVITEFGEELIGHRKNICRDLANALEERNGDVRKIPILPSDVSLRIDLKKGSIKCDGCGEYHPIENIRAEEKGEFIRYVARHLAEPYDGTCQMDPENGPSGDP
jgi:hypothetical protein